MQKEQVKVGQIWESMNIHNPNKRVVIRRIFKDTLSGKEYAEVKLTNGIKKRIQLNRFVPDSRGYRLISR